MNSFSRRAVVFLGVAGLVGSGLGVAPALAIPKEGAAVGSARVEDAEGGGLELKSLKGKPFVIVYDDKTSAPKSEALRREVVALSKTDAYKSKLGVVIVADVSPYDFWPAKGIVIDAVRAETRKQGITVYCDWRGDLRTAYKFKGDISNVVLVARISARSSRSRGCPRGRRTSGSSTRSRPRSGSNK
jgi:hypothetical protein